MAKRQITKNPPVKLPKGRSTRQKYATELPCTSTGIELVERIQQGKLDPAEWTALPQRHKSKKAVHIKRLLITQVLRNRGQSINQISQFLCVGIKTAHTLVKELDGMWGDLAASLDVKHWVGRIWNSADNTISKAMEAGDYALAWRIQKELATMMQELGALQKAPDQLQIGGNLTFVDFVKQAEEEAP